MVSIDRHAWRYGNTEQWASYTLRLARALERAGIPDVQREKRIWHDNPATAQWQVSFPLEHRTTATRVADGLDFPGERERRQANDRALRASVQRMVNSRQVAA